MSTQTISPEDAAAVAELDAAVLQGDVDMRTLNRGIYLTGYADRERVARGGGGTLTRFGKLRGWDNLAVVPEDTKTTAEAMKKADLDWRVYQTPVLCDLSQRRDDVCSRDGAFVEHEYDGPVRAERFVANVREDNGDVLGIVGKNWRGPQNGEAFGFIDDLVDDGSAKWIGAGTMDGGRRVWGLLRVEREVIPGGDVDERCIPLMFVQNGWDGSVAYGITSGPFREACTNGMTIPLPGYRRVFKMRHTSGVQGRVEQARKALGLTIAYLDAFEDRAAEMMATPFGRVEWDRFVERLLPMPEEGTDRQRNTVETKRLALRGEIDAPDLANVKGTLWGAYNAVTSYADWFDGTRKSSLSAYEQDARRLDRQFSGAFKDRAYGLLVG